MDPKVIIAAIREDVRNMAREMKSELGNFQNRIREDLKKELTVIREEIKQKLGEVVKWSKLQLTGWMKQRRA